MRKPKTRRVLKNAGSDKAFWLKNGQMIINLKELFDSVNQMSDLDFEYHVNKEKNDFVNWIKNVLGEEDLAKKMVRYKSKLPFISILKYHIEKYY